MNQDKNNDLRDLTKSVTVTFGTLEGRTERRFVLREHSRAELDHYIDLQQDCNQSVIEAATSIGERQSSVADTVKAVLTLSWESLAPVIEYILREPTDGLPAPTAEEIRQNLNERKCMQLIKLQDELDGIPEKKKALEETNKTLARIQLEQLQSGVSGTQ